MAQLAKVAIKVVVQHEHLETGQTGASSSIWPHIARVDLVLAHGGCNTDTAAVHERVGPQVHHLAGLVLVFDSRHVVVARDKPQRLLHSVAEKPSKLDRAQSLLRNELDVSTIHKE